MHIQTRHARSQFACLVSFLTGLVFMVFSAQLYAHSAMAGSVPAAGKTVAVAEKLEVTFNEQVRLLRLVLNKADSDEDPIDFGFVPTAATQTAFSYELPALESGTYSVTWTVIGTDGHTVSESFRFTIDPSAASADESATSSSGHDDHHHH